MKAATARASWLQPSKIARATQHWPQHNTKLVTRFTSSRVCDVTNHCCRFLHQATSVTWPASKSPRSRRAIAVTLPTRSCRRTSPTSQRPTCSRSAWPCTSWPAGPASRKTGPNGTRFARAAWNPHRTAPLVSTSCWRYLFRCVVSVD